MIEVGWPICTALLKIVSTITGMRLEQCWKGCCEILWDESPSDPLFLLFRGAAEGEGLGNAFLSHISEVDGVFHMCRGFEDTEVVHVEDRVDPVADLEIIHA